MWLWIVLSVAVYLGVGMPITRYAYAKERYRVAQLSYCNAQCGSRSWTAPNNRKKYCTCGYLNPPSERQAFLFWLFWLPISVVESMSNVLTNGTYEPKEVKEAREERERIEEALRSDERLKALERAAGIRDD